MTGLVGWWPLHRTFGDAVDLSGKGNDGTINGTTRGVAGRGGIQGYDFNGSSDYVDIPAFSAFSQISICLWAKADDTSTRSPIGLTQNNHIRYQIGGDYSNWWARIRDDGNNKRDVSSSISNTNQWVHLGLTWDGSTLTLYVNGNQEDTTSCSSMKNNQGEGDHIGRRSNAGGFEYWFKGGICDVRIYDRALSSAEVSTLYDWGGGDYANPPGASDGGVAYYTLDEDPGSTSTATDSWGSNDGTISGPSQADPAIRGTGMSFGGSGDTVDLGSGSFGFSDGDPITVMCWAKPSSDGNIICLWNGTNSIVKGHRVTSGHLGIRYYDGSGSTLETDSTYPDAWAHIAATHDGTTTTLWVNGSYVDSADFSYSVESRESAIGGNTDSNQQYISADIDDVRIYNRALSAAEIHEAYRYGTFGRDLRAETVIA